MMEVSVHTFANLEELSHAAAARFVERCPERAEKGSVFAAALSGGSTPRRLYELLGEPRFSPRMAWDRVHLFQVDERCVPPDHAESNYRMIRESLLDRVGIPSANVHRIQAELPDPENAAELYTRELGRVLRPPRGELPRLDLVFLGMGPDGHTASLFPGSSALAERAKWVSANFVEKLRANRITLTYPVLNAAREIIFLVAGEEKAETLRRVLEGPQEPERLPAQGIRPVDGRLEWFLDTAAAARLKLRAGSSG
ncbi:MAG: 6-phosphogluconolactonase [Acidobacteriia bacterium]|nr:6-phosphogluconolactonase [Terriglobia bacterium]